ncbi:Retron-type RNA-directed DNA polymerase [Frigoriglobus tundricola]|uniref:Retron-type RNA-directed DNA polymerase n=1 Tax=Frigoriglobus tundricola TaxID=2774151 RepID=A0A6M5Z4G1_9BACT|nr:Retron-type RNA-directed DNA polymerase [Frigoriglobus tundricola]
MSARRSERFLTPHGHASTPDTGLKAYPVTRRPDFLAHSTGREAHVAAVNPVRGRKLWVLFDRIDWSAPPGAPLPVL